MRKDILTTLTKCCTSRMAPSRSMARPWPITSSPSSPQVATTQRASPAMAPAMCCVLSSLGPPATTSRRSTIHVLGPVHSHQTVIPTLLASELAAERRALAVSIHCRAVLASAETTAACISAVHQRRWLSSLRSLSREPEVLRRLGRTSWLSNWECLKRFVVSDDSATIIVRLVRSRVVF
jgi:hypothetical protein